ncbi:MAG: hypothetical protein IT379_39295 [Deltaproteobacteria bacterium]|nr:hypothetical protein [Deltaproteobacteria bacterium]
MQRVEEGRGLSAETLLALAGALDASKEELRTDALAVLAQWLGVAKGEVTAELLIQRVDEAQRALESEHIMIPLQPVTTSAHLHAIFDAKALHFDCASESDAVLDAAAELKAYLRDLLDVRGEADAVQQRAHERDAFALVEALRKLGLVVAVGLHEHEFRVSPSATVPMSTLYVIVMPKDDVRAFAAMRNDTPVRVEC